MKLNEGLKKILFGILGIAVIIVCLISFLTNDLEHIEDTNGPDDYSLAVITDENIINMDTGALGGPTKSTNTLSGNAINFSADKYTGVSEILYDNYILKSDFDLSIHNFEVYEGNLRLLVINDGKIIAELEPGMVIDCYIEDITGYVSLRIAGESASFSFSISGSDYERHSHN